MSESELRQHLSAGVPLQAIEEEADRRENMTEAEIDQLAKDLGMVNDPEFPHTWTDCYAVPGAHSIIDLVHPTTRLTCIYGKTLEQVQQESPGAVPDDGRGACSG